MEFIYSTYPALTCFVRGAAGLGQGEGVPLGRADMRARRYGRAPGGVAVGARARLSVERACVCSTGRSARAPAGVTVDAGARLPVGRSDVSSGRLWRAPGCVEVGAGERLPVERKDVVTSPLGADTWRCCGGRGSTTAHGAIGRVAAPPGGGNWRCCSGRGRTAARGTGLSVKSLPGTTPRLVHGCCCNRRSTSASLACHTTYTVTAPRLDVHLNVVRRTSATLM